MLGGSDGLLYEALEGERLVAAFGGSVRGIEAGRVDGSPSTARFGYDPGGGGSGPEIPETTLTSPTYDQVFTSSPVTASGTASADVAIATVQVAVKDRTTNEWYDAATDTWHAGFRWNDAALGVPGATSTSWSLEMPLAPGGYHLQARAIDTEGDIDPTRETARFDVTAGAPDTVAPDTSLDTPYEDEVLAPNPTLDGAAADAVGVTRVDVAIKDRDSGLWYDTSAGTWSAGFRWNVASLASPGATATTWSLATALGVGDYHVQARAVDAAGNVDASRASLRFSVADVATFTDWIELFDLPDGTTSDTGDTAWTLSAGGGTASVQSGAVTLSNTGGEAVWRSEVLDISAGPVSIAIDWEGAGPMETSADYFRAYYRIDGGAEVEIASRPGPFSFETISAAGLTGSTLEIVVRQYNTFDDEIHRLHRVAVTAG